MRIALRELVRRPARFLAAGGALTLLVVLLLILGGFLDGLVLGATGAFRTQDAELVVYSDTARTSLFRSRLNAETIDAIRSIEGVERVSGFGINQVPAVVPGAEDLVNVAVAGYETGAGAVPDPPAPGEAVADRRLEELAGASLGDMLEVGQAGVEVEIVAWVDDTTFQLQPTLWVEPGTWREVTAAGNPAGATPDGTFQVALVELAPGARAPAVADAIDDVTGSTSTVTMDEAISALPGVEQQQSVFAGIIGVTFGVAGLVVALFFALITLERMRLYAMLKAIGARSGDLIGGVTAQALGVAAGAVVVGGLIAVLVAIVVPPELPVRLETARVLQIAAGTIVTATLGSLVTLRRILRVDPARAIG